MQKIEELLNTVCEAIQNKKGENIVDVDLSALKHPLYDHFVICDAQSKVQVEAIAKEIKEKTKKDCNVNPAHIEGLDNAEWVLIDYFDIVVHVFQSEIREKYSLESLWADANIKVIA